MHIVNESKNGSGRNITETVLKRVGAIPSFNVTANRCSERGAPPMRLGEPFIGLLYSGTFLVQYDSVFRQGGGHEKPQRGGQAGWGGTHSLKEENNG